MAEYITERCLGIAGRLALVGSPTEVVRGAYNDIMMMAFTAVQAVRRGQYEFWHMSIEDTGSLDGEDWIVPLRTGGA